MTRKCPVAPNPIQRLITHKDYAVEMVNSIINETDLDPCAAQSLEDLGASSLFDLSRVCSHCLLYYVLSLCSPFDGRFCFKCWCG